MVRRVALALFVLAALTSTAFAQESSDRPNIAIARVQIAQSGWTLPPPQVGAAVVDMMMTELVGAARFHVYDGQWLVPNETSGASLEPLRAAAAVRHVDYLVVGTLTAFSTEQNRRRFGGLLPRPLFLGGVNRQQTSLRVSLSFRLVDVRTGEIVTSVIGDGYSRRRATGLGGLGVVHGLPVGALVSAAAATTARDAMLNDALRQAVHAAAVGLSTTTVNLTHTAQ